MKKYLLKISVVMALVLLCAGLSACAKKASGDDPLPATTEPAGENNERSPSEPASSTPTAVPTPTSTPSPTPTPTPSPTPTAIAINLTNDGDLVGVLTVDDWTEAVELPPITYDYVISKVNEFVNVREEPNTDSKIIGKLRLKSYGRIIERADGWTKIASGDVEGYVCNDYLYMDEEAIALFDAWDVFNVTVQAGQMNVRKEPNTDCDIIGQAYYGEEYVWYPELSDDEWYAIQYTEEIIAYVNAAYTVATSNLDQALTMAQEEARVKAEWFKKAMEISKLNPPAQTNRDPISLTDEELYLMSVVIAMEALDEPYEGKLMVANVIVNRILNGYWGHTLHDVIYAPGQFTGANSGRVEQFWYRVTDDCKRAAYEAVMGNNNIEDYLFFISIGKAQFDKYTKFYVFHGHCFYKRNW